MRSTITTTDQSSRKVVDKEKLTAEQKFQFVIEKYSFNRMVRYLCELVSVSSLGYCRYFSEEARRNKQAREKAAKIHRTLPNL